MLATGQRNLKTLIMPATFLGPVKFLVFLGSMMLFIVNHAVVSFLIWDKGKRNRYYLKSMSVYTAWGRLLLGIKVIHRGPRLKTSGALIVANHMSYIDVLVLIAKYPSLFVTSNEIKETPVLGRMTELAGCFFVERRRSLITPETKGRELSQMKNMLAKSFNVLLFPEGTSSDGTSLLPFKNTFFQLALDANVPVVPVVLRYHGEARDVVPWYGSMTFMDHLLKVCMLADIGAELIELPPVTGQDRFELAQNAQRAIKECYEKH